MSSLKYLVTRVLPYLLQVSVASVPSVAGGRLLTAARPAAVMARPLKKKNSSDIRTQKYCVRLALHS